MGYPRKKTAVATTRKKPTTRAKSATTRKGTRRAPAKTRKGAGVTSSLKLTKSAGGEVIKGQMINGSKKLFMDAYPNELTKTWNVRDGVTCSNFFGRVKYTTGKVAECIVLVYEKGGRGCAIRIPSLGITGATTSKFSKTGFLSFEKKRRN